MAGVEHVDVAELREVLRNAQTIREVGQQLDISRERAFRLLNTLDLVDLVSGRLESANRSVSADEIDRRLANAAADGD